MSRPVVIFRDLPPEFEAIELHSGIVVRREVAQVLADVAAAFPGLRHVEFVDRRPKAPSEVSDD